MYKFFINRPIVSMVISIIMVIVGAVAALSLPTAQFPNIADPQIQVLATYVGADALTVEQSVATPIEQQMSGVDNMEYMYSLNANNGQMTLTVDFNVKTDRQYGSDSCANEAEPGGLATAERREQLWRDRAEVHGGAADVVRLVLTERKL